MYATLQFISNTINTIAVWLYSNPVCCAGLFCVGINLFAYLVQQLRKLI